MENTDVNSKAVIGICLDNTSMAVKIESESVSSGLINESIIKTEAPESHETEEYCVYIKNENVESPEWVYCDTCLKYCKDGNTLKTHLEINPKCKQYNNASVDELTLSNSLQNENWQNDMQKQCNETVDMKRCAYINTVNDPSKSYIKASTKIDIKSGLAEKPHFCDICEKSFSQKSHLVRHKLIHSGDKPFICHVCNKSFNQSGNLVEHMRTHAEEKLFSCDICNQLFTTKSYLIRHKLSHTGVKSYFCDVCGRTFTHKSNLTVHRRTHTREKPFSCSVCNQSFTQKGGLNKHKQIHTGLKAFCCVFCDQSFARKDTLVKHMRTHNGHKPLSCDVCNRPFTRKSSLSQHKRKHNTVKRFSCNFCNCSFTHKNILLKHKAEHVGGCPSNIC